jgi:uncharacterized membrane protein YvbJ
MFCSNCGAQFEGKFCSACGTASPNSSQAPAAADPLVFVQTRSATPTFATAQTSGLAIAALILSFIFPFIGIILGFVARSDISKSNGTKSGEQMANIAIVLGFVFMFLQFLVAFFWAALWLDGSWLEY